MVVLIIGLGSIAKKHITAIKNLRSNVVFIAYRHSNNCNNIEGVENIFSLDNLECLPDFAIISNPTSQHFNTINVLIELKIPMFIEKPAIEKIENAEILLLKIKKYNIFTYVGCNLRFHPCIDFLKNNLFNKSKLRINEINIYCGSYLPDWRPDKDFRKIYSSNSKLGGGVHLDLIHEIDYTYWFFGVPNSRHSYKSSKSSLHIDSIDYANYIFEYEGFNVSIILNYFRKDSKRHIEIVCANETFFVDLLKCSITSSINGLLFENRNYNSMNTYTKQMNYFLNFFESKNEPMNTFEESIQVLKLV